eukprot:4040950-Pleurochrysis_carterae.AAC.1
MEAIFERPGGRSSHCALSDCDEAAMDAGGRHGTYNRQCDLAAPRIHVETIARAILDAVPLNIVSDLS